MSEEKAPEPRIVDITPVDVARLKRLAAEQAQAVMGAQIARRVILESYMEPGEKIIDLRVNEGKLLLLKVPSGTIPMRIDRPQNAGEE